MNKFVFLRKKYPEFVYLNYSYEIKGGNLEISFVFQIEPDIEFKPKISVKNIDKTRFKKIKKEIMDNLIFHLGLMEIPSYWKTTCSPEIVIKAGYLNGEQIKWWEKLIISGMGQFFYENRINWRKPDFLKIATPHIQNLQGPDLGKSYPKKLKNRYLVPFGGGRDSIVTLEKLKKRGMEIALFMVNPPKQIQGTAKVSGIKKRVIVERKIDKKLLKLNKKGYLNGHTPFTALLSFLAVFYAVLFGYKNIAFSNEKSANEGNVKYLGKIINHQWAKSSEFEKMFRDYCKKYLAENINYFSFLRKYTELEISRMFAKYPRYFPIFSSCNRVVVKKIKKRWCGECPKCLFVYMTLYPFLDKKQLLKIFGKDLFDASAGLAQEKNNLISTMKGLLGGGKHKPFECVGTKKESRMAFKLSLKRAKKFGKIPYLLKRLKP